MSDEEMNGDVEEVVPEPPAKKKKRRQTDINGSSQQPSSSKPNGVRHTMNPSDFNQFHFEAESDHVVAVMEHFRLKESETPHFNEHVFKTNKKIYSFKNKAAPDITFLGQEKKEEDDNFDYCLAVYNRRTRILDYKPLSILRFQGIPNIDPALLTGQEIKKKVNYQGDYSLDQESMIEQRKQLTTQFGSEKKNKMLEAAIRRKITDDTLTTLSKSTFESKNVVKKSETVDAKAFEAPQSSILPPANLSATVPKDIYPLSLFYTEFKLQTFGKSAQEFFKKNNKAADLTKYGVPKGAAEVAKKVLGKGKSEKECYLMAKFIVMAAMCQNIHQPKKKAIDIKDLRNFPQDIVFDVLEEFFDGKIKSNEYWSFTFEERDRFDAWFLCLYLVLNDFRVAITPLVTELKLSDQKSGKTLAALGCIVSTATQDEATLYDTKRVARLLEPPTEKKFLKLKRRR